MGLPENELRPSERRQALKAARRLERRQNPQPARAAKPAVVHPKMPSEVRVQTETAAARPGRVLAFARDRLAREREERAGKQARR